MTAEQTAKVEALCRRYLDAIERGGPADFDALFAEDATATSPLSGPQPAGVFYRNVLRITSDRSTVLRNVLVATAGPRHVAVHFDYTRTVRGGRPGTIECVDLFELTADLDRFASVRIIYDIAPVRTDFDDK
ncbi:nuclear transport factor 2 family protein [Ruegeria sediminis]|uniref:Nuclear transport factor 2 family protein n=1 Tax=Ruegeria sediminis TaxID=2583820 RepID=A0ABY2WTK1_9RHOB|nr:nuclear transport factor 2 family protein [Ruegeria sediminis]TMV04850.1 nuclear transport factor 2 family protein [Ruegeria sediminis]